MCVNTFSLSEVIRSCTSELAYGVAASDRSASRSGEENSAVDPISEDPIKRDPIDDVREAVCMLCVVWCGISLYRCLLCMSRVLCVCALL